MSRNLVILSFATATVAMGALDWANAQPTPPSGTMQEMPIAGKSASDMVEGEVRKIDKDAKKITLKHAEIPNLEMASMTMVFQVNDTAMLDAVKVGDKVRFQAQKVGGAIVITELQPVK